MLQFLMDERVPWCELDQGSLGWDLTSSVGVLVPLVPSLLWLRRRLGPGVSSCAYSYFGYPKSGCLSDPSRTQGKQAWGKQCVILQYLHFPDTFSWQILTQEDWNKVLYNGMASTSSWAALYFIALMTFGNYVLFNLLVAILVEGFQTEVMSSHLRLCFLLKFQGLQILEFDF